MSTLHWSSTLVILSLVSLILLILATVLTIIQYFKDRYSHLKYLAGVWVCGIIWIFFQILSDLTIDTPELSFPLHIICFYMLIPMGYLFILFIDSITRDSIDFLKFTIMTIASTAVVLLSFLEDEPIIIAPESDPKYPTINGDFKIATGILIIFLILLSFYAWLKIYRHSPKNLKKYSLLNLLAAYIYGIQPFLFQIEFLPEKTSIVKTYPGIATASLAIGLLLFAIIFIKEPKLAYILPFKAYSIMIQRTESGIILFKHDWNKLEVPDSEHVFSGMLLAINTMFDLTINKGNVKKIKFEEAEITFKASKKGTLACILISSASSITLRNSFTKFTDEVFKDSINIEKNDHSTNSYQNGSFLVEKYFPFIP